MKEYDIVLNFLLVICLIFFAFFVGTGENWAILGWVVTGLMLVTGAILMAP